MERQGVRICLAHGCRSMDTVHWYCPTHVRLRITEHGSHEATQNTCEFYDCDRNASAKGLCEAHYSRARRKMAVLGGPLSPRRLARA
jgi:hypothetical protein